MEAITAGLIIAAGIAYVLTLKVKSIQIFGMSILISICGLVATINDAGVVDLEQSLILIPLAFTILYNVINLIEDHKGE